MAGLIWNQSLYGWERPVWLKVKLKCSFCK